MRENRERERGLWNMFQNPDDSRVVPKIMKELRADVSLTRIHYGLLGQRNHYEMPKMQQWPKVDTTKYLQML